MHNQRVASLQRQIANIIALAQRLTTAMQSHHGKAIGLAHPHITCTLADQLGTGRNNHFGNTGAGRCQYFAKFLQAGTLLQTVFFNELVYILRGCQDAHNHPRFNTQVTCQRTWTNACFLIHALGRNNPDMRTALDIVKHEPDKLTAGRHLYFKQGIVDAIDILKIAHGI